MIGGFLPVGGGFGIDAAISHIFTQGSRGRIDERPINSTSSQAIALNSGAYTLSAYIASFSLKYSY